MKRIITLIALVTVIACANADYLVYDSSVWAQSVVNCNAELAAMEKQRVLLNNILTQALNANTTLTTVSTQLTTANTTLTTISNRLGDPDNMVVNLQTTPSANLNENKELDSFRKSAAAGSTGTNGEKELYGIEAEPVVKYQASEWAYNNFENVLAGNLAAKKALILKRDAIIAAMEMTNSIAEVEKLNGALIAINGKLDTIHEQEMNAMMKLMSQQIRNDQQEKMKKEKDVSDFFSVDLGLNLSDKVEYDFSEWNFDK